VERFSFVSTWRTVGKDELCTQLKVLKVMHYGRLSNKINILFHAHTHIRYRPIQVAVFWVVTQCDRIPTSRGTALLPSPRVKKSAWCHSLEDSDLNVNFRENLKSQNVGLYMRDLKFSRPRFNWVLTPYSVVGTNTRTHAQNMMQISSFFFFCEMVAKVWTLFNFYHFNKDNIKPFFLSLSSSSLICLWLTV
jgi:hypothetical protein